MRVTEKERRLSMRGEHRRRRSGGATWGRVVGGGPPGGRAEPTLLRLACQPKHKMKAQKFWATGHDLQLRAVGSGIRHCACEKRRRPLSRKGVPSQLRESPARAHQAPPRGARPLLRGGSRDGKKAAATGAGGREHRGPPEQRDGGPSGWGEDHPAVAPPVRIAMHVPTLATAWNRDARAEKLAFGRFWHPKLKGLVSGLKCRPAFG